MKHLVSMNYDQLSNLDKMRAIQKVVSEIEVKILVHSELGNQDVISQYDSELKELNMLYLDIMISQDELDDKCQAFESFINNLNKAA